MAYNQENQNNLRLRHLFFPNRLSFLFETALSLGLLFVLNLTAFGEKLFENDIDNSDPVSFGEQLFDQQLADFSANRIFEQISVFLMWAAVGMLIYILLFWVAKIISGTFYSLNDGVKKVRTDSTKGFLRWFESLHDFLLKVLLEFGGLILLLFGIFVCFSFASYQLNFGLMVAYPESIERIILSIVSAILAVRLIIVGLCFLLPRFRRWYCT